MTISNKENEDFEASKAALAAAIVAHEAATAHKAIYETAAKTAAKAEFDVGYEALKTAIRESYAAYEVADETLKTAACESYDAFLAAKEAVS